MNLTVIGKSIISRLDRTSGNGMVLLCSCPASDGCCVATRSRGQCADGVIHDRCVQYPCRSMSVVTPTATLFFILRRIDVTLWAPTADSTHCNKETRAYIANAVLIPSAITFASKRWHYDLVPDLENFTPRTAPFFRAEDGRGCAGRDPPIPPRWPVAPKEW